ncbi:MAG: gamma-glutamylcyclotransferase [Gammaproteobacteria bacterium]|nr:gamma-glutamylcyclotransferase [Gammaproteobacteria bacterium]
MSTFSYFAYGSNLLSSRLVGRCASATFSSIAVVRRHRLEFTKPSIDGSGKATIISDETAQGSVFGAVFQISNAELETLDAFEGKDYERRPCQVTCVRTGREIGALTYYARQRRSELLPYDWYLALVVAGLNEHEIDREYVSAIRSLDHKIDAEHGRIQRRAALEAFKLAGVDDYKALLR